jgi:hypothetical protein
VLTRLFSDLRGVSLEMGNREEPERKRRKSTLSEQVVEEDGKHKKTTKLLLLRLLRMLRMKMRRFHRSRMYLAVVGGNLVTQGVCLRQVTSCMSRIVMSKGLLWKVLSFKRQSIMPPITERLLLIPEVVKLQDSIVILKGVFSRCGFVVCIWLLH